MASSKLLKEAIADAKAVRETAIANAKIALEEAFTPRLQSILSQKLQAEMEGDEEDTEDAVNEDNDTSSEIAKGDNKQPADKANSAQTDLSGISKQSGEPGSEGEETKVKDLTEGEDEFGAEEEIPAEEPAAMEGEDMAPEMDMDPVTGTLARMKDGWVERFPGLQVYEIVQPVFSHYTTKELMFISQAHQWHCSNLEPEVRASLLEYTPEQEFYHYVSYGDDQPLNISDLELTKEVINQIKIEYKWQQGDILFVDNLLCLHGRNSYIGNRKILVSMANSWL